jgi:hypothetical protein
LEVLAVREGTAGSGAGTRGCISRSPGRSEDEVWWGEIKRRRRGYFGLFPSATKTGARPELAQGLKELTTSSHTSLKAPSLRHPATQDENRNRLNEETKINAWAPQLRSEENAER